MKPSHRARARRLIVAFFESMMAIVLLIAPLFANAAAPPPTARIGCTRAGGGDAYDCTIRLAAPGGAPLRDARFTVSADMPSMPMAHNLRPVAAVPDAAPGVYRARLALEMPGVWLVRLDFSTPARLTIARKLSFDDAGAR
ncbi:FixH family protein [Burkholderia glumae]|uniref:FixH family protein n=2 Tax=Burkholderia glumae TaxID=337 RepID=A0AAP9Y3N2_BURGL|nr:FixH family protein [Burkholderia glumae]AJY67828.1 ytkA-like family protein [Burkholderia glumae LMG 2196 = ATCC 33617]MCM2483297.1 FixH family protein [Burkholderia glumae]MCM2493171.1 FixH family protein [Burkholderia glumae]MCM2506614.1 FixH family protein [Burkholderia glumae]MCM2538286.1 FixH family protein [Burkholderia glumae]